MKRALIIGIDDYKENALNGCVSDAVSVENTLKTNGDGSPNFSTRLLTSSPDQNSEIISTVFLNNAIDYLFKGDAETVLFYFAGHGMINTDSNTGYIVTQDGTKGAWGVSIPELLARTINIKDKINSIVIILDCCHSGVAGEIPDISSNVSVISKGLTILTACHRNGTSAESNGQGLFTSMFIDGLMGSASDIRGKITPASVYSHIDQTLGAWDQRPIYKANVQSFITLREVPPKVQLDILRRLPKYFPDPTTIFKLDPSFEPDRKNVPKAIKKIKVDEDNCRIFKELQMCNRHGLVIPDGAEHMYYAAIESKGCKLTALGAHYRKLAELSRI